MKKPFLILCLLTSWQAFGQQAGDPNDYLRILRENSCFVSESRTGLPQFIYYSEYGFQGPLALANPRNYFSLREIAGDGDEISQIVNLCRWATDAIPHDGTHDNVCEMTAIDLYHYHKATGYGVNCFCKAVMLTELYLSMEFPARTLFCYPKTDDGDNHVITEVYSETLGKWLWMDPSFNVRVMDEDGTLMGVREVRERLVEGRPLILNDDCNLTGFEGGPYEDYLNVYMAKNLFKLECMSLSTYNLFSNYYNHDCIPITMLSDGTQENEDGWEGWIETTDPDYFWSKPTIRSYWDETDQSFTDK